MTESNSLPAFVDGVRRVLNDKTYWAMLMTGCQEEVGYYSIENMVRNYHDGILGALKT